MTQLIEEITTAVHVARSAGWPVDFRNGKVVITAPNGKALTVGTRPNEETVKDWRSVCRRYNLIGEGPARTPEQQEEDRLATANGTPVDAKVQAEQEAKAAKKAEADVARRKAEEVVAQASKLPTPPPSPSVPSSPSIPASPAKPVNVPVVAVTKVTPDTIAKKAAAKKTAPAAPGRDKDGFPQFSPDMLTSKTYAQFKLPSGRYFCPNCWSHGEKETFKAPQGVASHRGFRHATFSPEGTANGEVALPESLLTALELLRLEMVEVVANATDESVVKEQEEKIKGLGELIERQRAKIKERETEISKLGSEIEKLKLTAEQRGTLLDGEKARFDREAKAILDKVGAEFLQFREWINSLAPVRAVGKIDEAIGKYLGDEG
jgi:hypothetical protein